MNLFLGSFDQVLARMSHQPGVDIVVCEAGKLRNLQLQAHLQACGVRWLEVVDRPAFDAFLAEVCHGDWGEIELCVVAGFSYILPQDFIDCARQVINFHPGLVQQCRGPHPVANAILSGHLQFGATVHCIDSTAIDAGPIIAQRLLAIDYGGTYRSNYQRMMALLVTLATEVLPAFSQDKWPPGQPWLARPEAYQSRLDSEQRQRLSLASNLTAYRPA